MLTLVDPKTFETSKEKIPVDERRRDQALDRGAARAQREPDQEV